MKKVAFYTLGCKVNQYETNGMIQKFQACDYEIVEFNEFADIYIINTCTVTSISDKKSRQFLRQAKKINPNAIVVACGCYVQVAKDEIEKIDEIDLTVGTNEKANIVEYVENFINSHKKIELENIVNNCEYDEFGSVTYTEKTRAVIKIQDGCDNFCTYCIIPYARGRVRSRKSENIIEEVKEIVSKGIKEIVLTGIHIASYGKDFNDGYKLIDLLEDLNKIDGLKRIRLGSIEPLLISEEFMNRLVKLDKVCHHFHLSLQSACTDTLKRMNRKYTIEQFKEIVDRLRKNYSDVILTTDVIVGFAGETEEEFNITYENLKLIKFYKMHVFKYSQRKGTVAEKLPNQVTSQIKEERSKKLIELSNKNEKEYLNEMLGKELEVLFEDQDSEGYFRGHTSNYIVVKVKTDMDLSNKLIKIKIEENGDEYLIGKII